MFASVRAGQEEVTSVAEVRFRGSLEERGLQRQKTLDGLRSIFLMLTMDVSSYL